MAGNTTLPAMDTAAHCYCGHQFGNFAGQLGDGAVMYLGEVRTFEILFDSCQRALYARRQALVECPLKALHQLL